MQKNPIVSVSGLQKNFRIEIKPEGFKNRVKSLFSPEYREVKAVDGISFSIKKGEKVAFLGRTERGNPPLSKCSRAS
jgi:ABC-2 type transport system ATP-binding protein